MNLHRIVALAAAALAAAALAAQPADVEVVVTASRIEEPAERAAASVTVITAEELEASGQATLVDALERVAGVSFRSTTGSPSNAEVSMGGFGENSHGRVLVLVDGRRINRPDMAGPNWLQVPVENVERVEVLRGPATVLYGDHAVGGVINIITKKGEEKLTVTASAMGGSWLFNQERLGVSGAAGPVRFALSGERSASDGYRERSAWSSLGGGLNLDADLSDAVEASLRLGYNQTDYELPGSLTEAEWEDDPTQAAYDGAATQSSSLSVDAGLAALLGDLFEATVNLHYAWHGVDADVPPWFSYIETDINSFGATPRLRYTASRSPRPLTVTGGADLYLETLQQESFTDDSHDTSSGDLEFTKRSAGFYATAEIPVLERLSLTGGGRLEAAEIAAKDPLDGSKRHSGLAAQVGVIYHPVPSLRLHARYDRVYRYPFLDDQVVAWRGDFLDELEAEWGNGVTVGLDAGTRSRLRVSASAFALDMHDEIAWVGDFATGRNENIDSTRHLGASAEAGWKAGPVTVAAAYTWQLTTFRSGANDGNEVPLVPNHEVFGDARLALPAGFEVSANARYVSESYEGGDFANTQDKAPDYLVVGASATWRPPFVPGDLELFAGVENLFDAEYASYIYSSGYYPAPGRSWRVGAFYRY